LLRDADWAGMAHGVEIRAPLVDVPLYRSLCEPSDRCAYRKDDLRRLANLISPGLHLARRAKTGFMARSGQILGCGGAGATERAWTKGVLQHWFGDWAI
ncbi:MAG TPA: asparagine synthase-related protein, partial [Phenylobacterium sp.]|uniref:asparagine synthase-related protein n=1 Tax=Phenylobacterium sp. TaxID=1871053 RepID=UPI002BCB577A